MSDEYLLPLLMSRSTPEDILTEAVVYVLRNSMPFREVVAERAWGGGQSRDDFEIETQRSAGGGRADALWKAPGRTFILESKIWAQWGQEQPNRYVRELRDMGGEVIFGLVAPSTRLAALRNEAVRRLRKDFPKTSWNLNEGEAEEVRLVSFSWRDVGDWTRKAAGEENDARTKLHMEEICVVTDDIDPRFDSKPDHISIDGLGSALRDLCRIIVIIRARLESDGVEVGNLRSGDDNGLYYGFPLWPAPSIQLWFGVWIGPWAIERVSPLWLTAADPQAVGWLRSRVRGMSTCGKRSIVPVRLEGTTWEDAGERAVVRLNGIIKASREAE